MYFAVLSFQDKSRKYIASAMREEFLKRANHTMK